MLISGRFLHPASERSDEGVLGSGGDEALGGFAVQRPENREHNSHGPRQPRRAGESCTAMGEELA